MEKKELAVLLLFLLIGAFLRFENLDKPPLWMDEAEVAFLAKAILEKGVPNQYYNGIPIYSSPLMPRNKDTREDPEIFAYDQRDFREDGTPRYRPLGDAYIVSASFWIFGESTWAARIPFALLGVLSLLLTFKLAEFFFNARTGVMAVMIQAVNLLLIAYEKQAKYYSVSVFGFLGAIYFFVKAVEENKREHFAMSALFLVLLFYTQPGACLVALMTMFAYLILRKKCILVSLAKKNMRISINFEEAKLNILNERMMIFCGLFLILIVPYLIIMQPWATPEMNFGANTFSRATLASVWILLRMFVFIGFFPVLIGIILNIKKPNGCILFATFFLFYIVYFTIFPGASSFLFRMFLPLFPIACIFAGSFFAELISFSKNKSNAMLYSALIVLLVGLLMPTVFYPVPLVTKTIPVIEYAKYGFTEEIYEWIEGGSPYFWDTVWVLEFIDFAKSKNVSNEEFIFSAYQDLTIRFYSNYTVLNVWPVKTGFMRDLNKRFWVVIPPDTFIKANSTRFYLYSSRYSADEPVVYSRVCFHSMAEPNAISENCVYNHTNFYPIIQGCIEHKLNSGALVYEC